MANNNWKNGIRRAGKLIGALLGLVVIVVWTSGMLRDKQAPDKLTVEATTPVPPGAIVVTAQQERVTAHVALSGTVRSERQINLSARLPAYVEAVYVSAGAAVAEGDLLLSLDQRELRAELASAEAQLAQAETAFQRSKRLLETDATTAQAHESAESAYKSADANVKRVNVMLTYTRITAPLNGVVADRYIEAGDLAGAGQVLLSVYDPKRLRMEVPVPARLIAYFPVGQKLPVYLDQMTTTLTGTVSEVVSEFDPVTRTRRVKVRLDETTGAVLPGMYGQVIIETDPCAAVLLPEQAIIQIGQLESVQIVRDGQVYRRVVRTGPRHDGQVEILSGLAAGEEVWVADTVDVKPATPGVTCGMDRTENL